jgi:hypothetical protein
MVSLAAAAASTYILIFPLFIFGDFLHSGAQTYDGFFW